MSTGTLWASCNTSALSLKLEKPKPPQDNRLHPFSQKQKPEARLRKSGLQFSSLLLFMHPEPSAHATSAAHELSETRIFSGLRSLFRLSVCSPALHRRSSFHARRL